MFINIKHAVSRWTLKLFLFTATRCNNRVSLAALVLCLHMLSVREMATKIVIVSFERDSKTIHRSVLQNFYICFRDII